MSPVPSAPSAAQMDRLAGVLAPLARVTQPHVEGIDNLPDRGALYVGNHTLFAFLDLPFMMSELWQRRGIVVRGLGDHGHYAIPVWRDLLQLCGMVRGTRENVRELMAAGEDILVFPGGADEVFKGRDMKYQLLWKERLGFAKLAIEFGYPIVPFSAIGAEDMYDVVADNTTPGLAQVSALMKRLVGVPLPPIPRGLGLTMLPRPERLYFAFGAPIDTSRYDGDTDHAGAVRDEVKAAVLAGMAHLQVVQADDPARDLVRRLRGRDLEPHASDETTDVHPDTHFVTRAFEAWNAQGPAGAAAWMSPRIELADPPEWPEAQSWHGRDAVLARLEEVTGQLGGTIADVVDVRSTQPDEVEVTFVLRDHQSEVVGHFAVDVTLASGQIARAAVRLG